MSLNAKVDVAVVGAGLVGSSLALTLAQAGLRVTLLEARAPQLDWPEDSHDLRVSALTARSCQFLAQLGVWDSILKRRACPFSQMHVWDAGSDGMLHLDAADAGYPEMGFVVENRVTVAALWQALQHEPNLLIRCPARLQDYHVTADAITLDLDDGERCAAELLIGADGSQSHVRELAGISTYGWSYDQKALVATVRPGKPHQYTAWQRFLDEGPLALLPLPDNLISIVWTASPASTDARIALDEAVFCQALTEASENKLGHFELLGPRAGFPLRLQGATQYISDRVALVGDAIHTIHPLAGQGANLGLADAACLVDLLTAAHAKRRSIASSQVLRRYERSRKAENWIMMAAMDGLKRVYGQQTAPLPLLRGAGMQWLNATPVMKNWIARYAMGQLSAVDHFNPDRALLG